MNNEYDPKKFHESRTHLKGKEPEGIDHLWFSSHFKTLRRRKALQAAHN